MKQSTGTIAVDAVGRRVVGDPYAVTRDEIIAFAEATDDDTPAYREGRLAPPVYVLNPVLWTMVAAKKLAAPQFGFHGEHDIHFHQPIKPGMTIRPTAEVIGVRQRSSGVTVTVRVESHADRVLVNEQYFVSFVPHVQVQEERGMDAPAHDLSAGERSAPPLAELAYPLSMDQTRRYADASHDHDAYTLDEKAAREMGFPAILVHGMCTFAFSGRAVVATLCRDAPERLRRLAVRLSRPVYLLPGQRIQTSIWRRHDGVRDAFGFVSRDRDGDLVLTNGLAEVTPC